MYFPDDPLFAVRSDVPVGARRARARAAACRASISTLTRARMGARLPLRHRPARPRLPRRSRSAHERQRTAVATPSQTVGPFFHFGSVAPTRHSDGCAAGPTPRRAHPAARRRRRSDGCPTMRSSRSGRPTVGGIRPPDADGRAMRPGFGRMATGADGACAFETVRPGRCRDAADAGAAHQRLLLRARPAAAISDAHLLRGDPALERRSGPGARARRAPRAR